METLLIILFITVIITLTIISAGIIYYIKLINSSNILSISYLKTLDNDNIINIENIEQITQRYNSNEKQYEIIYYLKSGNELKETFDINAVYNCRERFNDIYNILNDLNY